MKILIEDGVATPWVECFFMFFSNRLPCDIVIALFTLLPPQISTQCLEAVSDPLHACEPLSDQELGPRKVLKEYMLDK